MILLWLLHGSLSIDDITLVTGRIHRRTYFKEHHKFSYVDHKSNHCISVFRGILSTEAIRYFRNSSNSEDYL